MKDYVKYVIVGSLVAFALVLAFTLWRYGAQGIKALLGKLFLFSLIVAFFTAIVLGVVWLFQYKRIDLIAVHKDNIVEACERNQTPYKQILSFSSQGDNWAFRELGRIIGYCMIKSAPRRAYDNDDKLTVIDQKYENMIFLTWLPAGLFNKIFSRYEVVAGTEEDFSTLSGDVVYLKGMTFAPKMFGLFFLSHHWEQRHFMDETIKENLFRYTLQEALKDLATIIEDAIDASPTHKKKQEIQNVQTVPMGAYVPQPPPQR